jgi:hypothetical protein
MWGIFGKATEFLASEGGLGSVEEKNWIMGGYKTAVCGGPCGLNALQNGLRQREMGIWFC